VPVRKGLPIDLIRLLLWKVFRTHSIGGQCCRPSSTSIRGMNIASVTDLTTINEDLLRFLDLQKLVYVCQIWIGEKGQIGSLSSNSGSDAGSEPTEHTYNIMPSFSFPLTTTLASPTFEADFLGAEFADCATAMATHRNPSRVAENTAM